MSSVIVENLCKSYKDNKVLNEIGLTIDNGKFITLLGPSGCGKSTLLRCIAGLTGVDQGDIYFDDERVTNIQPQKRNIGMVFQNYALFPNLNVEENIAFGLKVKKYNKATIQKEVLKYINLVALTGKEKSYPHQLSGGQKQRVALARALIVKPRILLLDEPLSALDAKIRKNLRLQIKKIQRELNITTIFVTHDQEEALIISDEIYVMHEGGIAQKGSAESIYTKPANHFVAGFIGNYNIIEDSLIKDTYDNKQFKGQFALRPEVIEVNREYQKKPNHLTLKGQLVDVILLGSVVRYVVKVNGKEIMVDVLNESEKSLYTIGEELYLQFAYDKLPKIG
ncbi:MAG: ABC transporter ATP-binding protein [Clostridia bacterium]|nr:ABC transporter ATP-binding protein [Clostridia bacterium]